MSLPSPVSVVLLHHTLDEVPVAGVELDLSADLHPADGRGVIPGLEREFANLASKVITKITMTFKLYLVTGLVVEVEDHGFHPGVVSVSRIVNITAVNLNYPRIVRWSIVIF